jgi:hypothetical protein
MSINVTKYPQRNVNDNTQFVSKWSAVHHEMTFEMQRRDYFASFSVNPGDNTQMAVTSFLPPGTTQAAAIGEIIRIVSNTGDEGDFEVVAHGGAGTLYVDIQAGFNPSGNGYLNKYIRENYFVLTNVYYVDEFNQYVLAGQSINKPNANGFVEVDVSSFLKSSVGYVNDFDYSVLNAKDLSLGGGYNITFSENWNNYTGAFSVLNQTELRFYVNAAKQIQDLYGQNMGEYLPFYFDTPSAAYPESKFLSDFESPTYFPGFPFTLGFLYSEYLVGIETNKLEEEFDVNGGSVGSPSSDKLENVQAQNVNRLTVNGSYPITTKCIEVWLETDGVEDCVEFLVPGYVAVGYVESICGLPPITDPIGLGGIQD